VIQNTSLVSQVNQRTPNSRHRSQRYTRRSAPPSPQATHLSVQPTGWITGQHFLYPKIGTRKGHLGRKNVKGPSRRLFVQVESPPLEVSERHGVL
jgi:hypothetical protein